MSKESKFDKLSLDETAIKVQENRQGKICLN